MVAAYFEVLSRRLPRETEEEHEKTPVRIPGVPVGTFHPPKVKSILQLSQLAQCVVLIEFRSPPMGSLYGLFATCCPCLCNGVELRNRIKGILSSLGSLVRS
jgi:hypothetical protein